MEWAAAWIGFVNFACLRWKTQPNCDVAAILLENLVQMAAQVKYWRHNSNWSLSERSLALAPQLNPHLSHPAEEHEEVVVELFELFIINFVQKERQLGTYLEAQRLGGWLEPVEQGRLAWTLE